MVTDGIHGVFLHAFFLWEVPFNGSGQLQWKLPPVRLPQGGVSKDYRSCGEIFPQRLGPVRHVRQRVGVVPGLVREVPVRASDRSYWSLLRLAPRVPGRGLERLRQELPVGRDGYLGFRRAFFLGQ